LSVRIKHMVTDYYIDIDPNSADFSKAFKDFYSNHFENTWGLTRGEVDTYFYSAMTKDENEIAKRLVRYNLKLRYTHLFKASGDLHDNEALPILYEHLQDSKDLSRQLTIGQAIWKINGDGLYRELLRKLQGHPDHFTKEAHFEQVTDLKNQESIEMLLAYLNDSADFVRYLALSKLNYLLTGTGSFENQFDKDYFLTRQKDELFRTKLLISLQRLA
jgi:hypothetical protein